ncbi:MAG: pilus assembly protein TadG-related protein, partial [Bradymonadaceae bacterium]
MDERRPSEGDDSLAPAAVLRAFHRAQRGAVIVAAFAAVLVLFMLGLTLYDASHVAGEKIDVQNAADAAAYSQAAVEARSMNMISFANAGKRTMSGLHNMYWAMWWAYLTWWSGECSSCCCCSITCCNCWSCSCRNCWFNAPLIIIEGLADWWSFSGLPIVPAVLPGAGHSGSAFAREMAELDSYQTYIADITPWWSWSEQLLRGSRNRATVTSSFPPPPDPLSVGINLLNRLTGLLGISLWPQFNFNDS